MVAAIWTKNNLYLVGYKGKFKEKDGTDQAEYWIVLTGKNHDQVVESVKEFLPSSKSYPVLVPIYLIFISSILNFVFLYCRVQTRERQFN